MTENEKINGAASEADFVTIALMPSGRRGTVPRGTNLLDAARLLGVELESICAGRQTCGKCQVVVEEGHFPKHALTSSNAHLTPPDGREAKYAAEHTIAAGRRLACACEAIGDLLLMVPEESQARKQIIAKAATDRAIEVQPAVRQVYVEVEAATLESHGGDWERLQTALAQQWQLSGLTIDLRALLTLQPALAQGKHALTVSVWNDAEVLRVQPGYVEGAYGLAVDIGSTTVVAHLCDLRTGQVLASEAAMNPQVRFGEDLMSRVSYVMMRPEGTEKMHHAVITTLNDLARKAAQAAEISVEDILDAVLVGNPVMHHLLLGLSPVELGGAPFALAVSESVELKARDLGLKFNSAARVHVLPCIAGHVGADNVAVQLAEAPHAQDELMLIVDVGTNAEIVLGNREQVLCCSSPTGPAFEGAQITHGQRAAPGAIERVRIDPTTLEPRYKVIGQETWTAPGEVDGMKATGICGSGIIEAIAELFLSGVIGADGLFMEAMVERTPRVRFNSRTGEYVLADAAQSSTGQPIVVTQSDVRAIQLGKAALYAGIKLLMQERGVAAVDRIVLAGAFGSYIDPKHAMVLGLIPDCELSRVVAVGNAAGDGARIALLNRAARQEAARLAKNNRHVQTAVAANFQAEFVGAIGIPHATDAFPHLAEILPAKTEAASTRRSQRRRERQAQAN
ncbi:MAG: DUF4445 domain-containing protein [Anaerolineales bacterium]|nr:DUF4445 domain-containing protein [Anaerolineales bacterium]